MKIIGAWLIALGIMSLMLGLVGLRVQILFLLDEFGPVIGYILKAALIVAGILLWRKEDRDYVEEEDVTENEGRRAWVPVMIGGVVIVAVISIILVSELKKRRVDKLVNRPVPAASWAGKPVSEWPCLVLLQKATFKHHTSMEAGCASLVRLPTGEVTALTAGHVLGKAGDVSPGFLRSGLGGLDTAKLDTLKTEIVEWQVYPPDETNLTGKVTELYGAGKLFAEECDQVLLRVSPGKDGFPVPPLDIRLEPVTMDEAVFVVAVDLNADGNLQQRVLKAKRIPGLGFTCALEEPAMLNGCSGAPVLDKNGLVVGIVTGGTLMDLNNQSGYSRAFSGHQISELLPVIRQAVVEKGVTAPAEVKAVVRTPQIKPREIKATKFSGNSA